MMESIYSPSAVRAVLDRYSAAPLKRLGQNFLIDENITGKIAAAGACKNVLEIGPGLGALTQKLAARCERVVAVDIDSGMVRALNEMFAGIENLSIIHADILKTDIKSIGEEYFGGEPFGVVGNLPYYITAKCILHVLDSDADVERLTVMVQREVAERLASRAGQGDYGALTASVAYYGAFELLFKVTNGCFYPRPDVESAVVSMEPRARFTVPREAYVRAVRTLFSMRRKTILNNLKSGLGISAEQAESLAFGAGLDPGARAETVHPEGFASLAGIITEKF